MSTKENGTEPGRIGCVTEVRIGGCSGTKSLVRDKLGELTLYLLTSHHTVDLEEYPHHRPIFADP